MVKTILLVEDSEDDEILFKLALNEAGVTNRVIAVASSEEALAYFSGDSLFEDRSRYPLPTVVCIDLKLRGRDGFHLLACLNTIPEASHCLTIVLSGHHEIKEVKAAYNLGADSFLSKPIHPKDVENLIRAYPQYWDFKKTGDL